MRAFSDQWNQGNMATSTFCMTGINTLAATITVTNQRVCTVISLRNSPIFSWTLPISW